jgi:hypothetical protein
MNTLDDSPFSIPSQGNREFFVYEYSVRIDKKCLPALWGQIKKARQLYNDIIAEIRQMFDDMNSFVFSHADASAITLVNDIEALTERLKEAKSHQDEDAIEEIIKTRREKRVVLFEQLRSVRAKFKSEIKRRFLSRVGNKASCETYQLRCDAVNDGLGWATANQVLAATLQAFSDRIKKGVPPLFARGYEKKQDSLKLQFTQAGGCAVESFLKGEHSGLRLNPVNGYGRRKYGEFSFRLGSASEDNYATGTCYFDRPLPKNATIVSASLVTRRIGKDYRYALQLVTKLLNPTQQEPVPEQRERFATIHFGWAKTGVGRHVMAIANQADPGAVRLISLPTSIEEDYLRAREKASARSKLLSEIIKEVKSFTLNKDVDSKIVEALHNLQHLSGIHVSQSRLYQLWNLLHNAEIPFPALDVWRKLDRLLWQDATYIPRRARMRRRDFYRDLASELSKTYRTIVMETIDLKKANTNIGLESGEASDNRKVRYGQKLAAIHEAIAAIRNACSKSGSIVLELKSDKTVAQCGYCASTNITVAPEDHQILQCAACGAEVNRKQNGAAVAWQLANQQIDMLTEEAKAFIAEDEIRKRSEAVAKREKMAAARVKARAERETQV